MRLLSAFALLAGLDASAQAGLLPGTTVLVEAGTRLRMEEPGTVVIPAGATVLNDGEIVLGPATDLAEAPGAAVLGAGVERTIRDLGVVTDLNIGGLGAEISSPVVLGITEVVRGHIPFTDYAGNTSIARWMQVRPTNNGGLNATMAFHYDPAELNGVVETDQVLHIRHLPDTWWALPGAVNVADRQVIASGLDSLGTFTTFAGELPNAIRGSIAADMFLTMDADGRGWLQVPGNASVHHLELFDLRGARIASAQVSWKAGLFPLPFATYSPGVYQVRVNGLRTFKWVRP
jgi:hypothetical protein